MESMKNDVGMSWERNNLGDIVTISKGKKHCPVMNGKNRYINIENLHNASNSLFTNESGVFVEENDIIIAWDGANAGKVGVGFSGVVGSTLARLKIKEEGIYPRFLYWFLEAKHELIKSQRTGVTIPHINAAALKELQIPLPPLPIQKRIAEILDVADALKRKDQALLKKYDELAQAIFIDMFGDPVKNEKGWEVKTIGSITNVGSGGTPSRQKSAYFGGKIHWVKTTEVNGEIIISTEELITSEGLKNSSCKVYPKDSVIVAMYGQGKTRGQVGILGVEAATNQACAVISPCKSLNPIFLFNYLKLSYKELRSLGRGGNQENLNKGIIEDFHVIVPPMKTQTKFNGLIDNIKHQQIKAAEGKSNSLFQALIQKAFKGELVAE
jgi:type I restriction enzyme S subunit